MQFQATSSVLSLAQHHRSFVVLTTSCIMHGNAKVPPSYSLLCSCLLIAHLFVFLLGLPAHGFLLILPSLWTRIYAPPSGKDAIFSGSLSSIFLPHEKTQFVHMAVERRSFKKFADYISVSLFRKFSLLQSDMIDSGKKVF